MRFLTLALGVLLVFQQTAAAQDEPNPDFRPSAGDFGGMGLLQTRSARVVKDGHFEVGYSRIFPYERYLITIQALPWLEGTFRYTSVSNRAFDGGQGGDVGTAFKDRGADLKFVLAREGRYTPALALGLQDGLGTGVFSGEYIVASKRFFDFDFSLGLGWGYLAGDAQLKNPLINLSDRFKSRTGGAQQGGTLLATSYFSGPNVGIFGGVEYATPIKGLKLKLEYDPNTYQSEPLANLFPATSHINYGVVYEPFPWIDFSLAHERGQEFMFRVSLRANLNDSGIPKLDPPVPALKPRPASAQATPPPLQPALFGHWSVDRMFDEFDRRGIVIRDFTIDQDVVRILPDPSSLHEHGSILQIASLVFPESPIVVTDESGSSLTSRAAPARAAIDTSLGHSIGASSGQGVAPLVWPFEVERQTADAVYRDAEKLGLVIDGVQLTGVRISVYLAGGPYRQISRNIGRAAIIAANNAPAEIEELEVVSSLAGMESGRIVIRRTDLEAAMAADGTGSIDEIWAHASFNGPVGRGPDVVETGGSYPDFAYALQPALRQHIGSGDQFYLYQLFLRASSAVQLTRGLSVDGAIGVDLYNNFDKLRSPPDSVLPNVRSNIKRYLQEGENNLIRLQANYLWSPLPNSYFRVSAGYLEEMFGGYGFEYLYRPFQSRFAVGIDLNYVRQRDFDQLLAFQDYTVLTGHLNLYYEIPFYDLLGQIHFGQYLAGDRGATFQISRRFESGIRAGAFATLTDVPFEVFGEGSFDKGFFVSIPLDLLSTRSSTNIGVFGFRPLTRDGGQRLGTRPRLYDVTAGGTLGSIARSWDEVLN
jgi:hypothetical protein